MTSELWTSSNHSNISLNQFHGDFVEAASTLFRLRLTENWDNGYSTAFQNSKILWHRNKTSTKPLHVWNTAWCMSCRTACIVYLQEYLLEYDELKFCQQVVGFSRFLLVLHQCFRCLQLGCVSAQGIDFLCQFFWCNMVASDQ